jgi:LCP family protein required for cell wall assembly
MISLVPLKTDYLRSRFHTNNFSKFSVFLTLLAVFLVSTAAFLVYANSQEVVNKVVIAEKPVSILDTVVAQIQNKPAILKGQAEGRTNVLFIGRDDGDRTDTILLGSYFWDSNKLVFMNIPRDFRITDGNRGVTKINAYMNGSSNTNAVKEEGLAKFLSAELSMPIHYWAAINITGVEKMIDWLGGVDIKVEQAFADCQFPTKNYNGYMKPCPSFVTGTQHMNGERAVIFARSRHSYNNPSEAIDFARSKRQTMVISAINQKLLQKLKPESITANLGAVTDLMDIIKNYLRTSITPAEIMSLNKHIQSSGVLKNERYILGYGDIICGAGDGTTDIPYCDGNIGGTTKYSNSRERLRKVFRELEKVETADSKY